MVQLKISLVPQVGTVLATVLLLSLGATDSTHGTSDAWDLLPVEITSKLHRHVDSLPPYPEDNDSLLNIRNWPVRRTIKEKDCVLEFAASRHDAIRFPISDFSAIPPGWNYSAHYVETPATSTNRTLHGPSYWWNSDSTLSERSYDKITWSYDRKGRIHQWNGPQQDEWFDTDGNLMAAGLGQRHYWQGIEVHWSVFKQKLVDYWKETGIYRKDSTTPSSSSAPSPRPR